MALVPYIVDNFDIIDGSKWWRSTPNPLFDLLAPNPIWMVVDDGKVKRTFDEGSASDIMWHKDKVTGPISQLRMQFNPHLLFEDNAVEDSYHYLVEYLVTDSFSPYNAYIPTEWEDTDTQTQMFGIQIRQYMGTPGFPLPYFDVVLYVIINGSVTSSSTFNTYIHGVTDHNFYLLEYDPSFGDYLNLYTQSPTSGLTTATAVDLTGWDFNKPMRLVTGATTNLFGWTSGLSGVHGLEFVSLIGTGTSRTYYTPNISGQAGNTESRFF